MPRTSHHGQGHSRGNGYDAWQSIIEKAKEAWEEWQKWLAAHSGSNGGSSSNGGHSSSGNSGSNSGSGGSQNNGNSGSNSGTGGGGASGHSSNDGSHSSGGGGGGDNGHENHTSSSDHGNDGAAHNSTSTGESSTASHGQSSSTPISGPTSGNSTTVGPSDTAVSPSPSSVPTSTLPEPNGTAVPQNAAVRKVNVAAIVAPVVLLTLFLLGVLAFILWRRRRAAHRQIRLESSSEVNHIPALPPPRPSPFATFSALATRLRGGAPTTPVVPVMVQPPSTASRPVSLASTAPGAQFEVRHPFAAPLYPSTSGYSFGAGSSSWVAAHGHSDSQSGQMQFPQSYSSPSLPGHTGMYGHRYGASASGSIVGSGVFSLASAHHGHGPGLTPGNELTDPFNGPAPVRPYSVADTEDSVRSESQLGRRGEFIPDADAPPVPPKPVMSPLSPDTPGSAFPLLGTGHPVRTPGEESQLSYLGDTESGPEPDPEPEAAVHLARRISVGPASLINAPKPYHSSE